MKGIILFTIILFGLNSFGQVTNDNISIRIGVGGGLNNSIIQTVDVYTHYSSSSGYHYYDFFELTLSQFSSSIGFKSVFSKELKNFIFGVGVSYFAFSPNSNKIKNISNPDYYEYSKARKSESYKYHFSDLFVNFGYYWIKKDKIRLSSNYYSGLSIQNSKGNKESLGFYCIGIDNYIEWRLGKGLFIHLSPSVLFRYRKYDYPYGGRMHYWSANTLLGITVRI